MADDESFREFVTMRWSALVRTAYLMTGDHGRAEDLAQSTLEKVHKHWGRISRMESPDAYTRRVMTNLVISGSRRRRLREISFARTPDVSAGDTTHDLVERDEVWQVLRELPPRVRAVMVLRYFEDLSENDIAAALGCSVGTVKSQHSRGLAKLRDLLERPGTAHRTPPVLDAPITAVERQSR